mmetsp:Transcript_6467/g.15149  ORF Transcript_6467/g.15149 Transcript_6467/m.15149 type:complete len:214 (-) Transcript_6467:683-1324(-)
MLLGTCLAVPPTLLLHRTLILRPQRARAQGSKVTMSTSFRFAALLNPPRKLPSTSYPDGPAGLLVAPAPAPGKAPNSDFFHAARATRFTGLPLYPASCTGVDTGSASALARSVASSSSGWPSSSSTSSSEPCSDMLPERNPWSVSSSLSSRATASVCAANHEWLRTHSWVLCLTEVGGQSLRHSSNGSAVSFKFCCFGDASPLSTAAPLGCAS